jgi:hypothetical protein
MPFIISSEYGDNNQCRRGPCAGYDTREDSNDLQIVIEALKIEKVSRHRLVRLWFLLLFAVAAATYLTMPKNMNVIVYREQLLQFLLTREAFPFPPREFFDAIIRKAFLIAVSMYFLLLYAVSWVDSQLYKTTVRPMFGDEMPTETGNSLEENRPASRLKGLHYLKFLTLAIATVVPYLLSALFSKTLISSSPRLTTASEISPIKSFTRYQESILSRTSEPTSTVIAAGQCCSFNRKIVSYV